MTPVAFPTEDLTSTIPLAFDPQKFDTAEAAAQAFYKKLCDLAHSLGYDPDEEVWIKNPAEAKAHGYGVNDWWVCWESGPYDWGIYLSGQLLKRSDAESYATWWTEPYWGFDLIFHQEARL